jgi:lipopolysaccharide biosynthesis glycosyltransferase
MGREPGVTRDIPLLFCCDPRFIQHMAVTLVSLLENSPDGSFDITVVTRKPFGDLEAKLRRTLAPYRTVAGLRVVPFSLPEQLDLPKSERLPLDVYLRIWVARFYPPEVEKIVYLDSDLVILGNLVEIWNTELGSSLLAAVPIPGSDRWKLHGTPEEYGYFNSGVMLLNLRSWRDRGCEATALDYARNHPERLLDGDQDMLNACFYDSWVRLPYVWNVISPFYKPSHPLGLPESEVLRTQQSAKIIHYNGVGKPWLYCCDHPRVADYLKYLRLTGWRDYVPPDRTIRNRIKKLAKQLLPPSARRVLKGFRLSIAAAKE